MPSDITPDDELTQVHPDLVASFVVRFWQEAPGCWRGTVRHVQSQAQRGVSSADQAGAFIARYLPAHAAARAARRAPADRPASWLSWFGGRRFQLAGMVAALLVISLSVVLMAGDVGGGVLAGAAVASALPAGVVPFAAGVLVGAAVVWWRSARRP
jgi:hypothetical protein